MCIGVSVGYLSGDSNVFSVPDANESAAAQALLGLVMSGCHPPHPLVPLRRRGNLAQEEEALSIYGRSGSVSQRVAECICPGESESAMPRDLQCV